MLTPQTALGLGARYGTHTSHEKKPAQAVLLEEQSRATEEHVVKAVSEEETPNENDCAAEVDVAEAFDQFVETKCHERIQELEKQNKELEEQKKQLEEDVKIANEKVRNAKQGEGMSETLRKKTLRQAWLEIFLYIILCIFVLSPEPRHAEFCNDDTTFQSLCYPIEGFEVTRPAETEGDIEQQWRVLKADDVEYPVSTDQLLHAVCKVTNQLISTGERVVSVMNAVGTQTAELVAAGNKLW